MSNKKKNKKKKTLVTISSGRKGFKPKKPERLKRLQGRHIIDKFHFILICDHDFEPAWVRDTVRIFFLIMIIDCSQLLKKI